MKKKIDWAGVYFWIGFMMVNVGVVMDRPAMVIAGCFWVWIAREIS